MTMHSIFDLCLLAGSAIAVPRRGYGPHNGPKAWTSRSAASVTAASSYSATGATSVSTSSAASGTVATTTSLATTSSAGSSTDASSTVAVTTTSSTASNTDATTTLLATATATDCGLNDAAKALGRLWFGTAADIPGPELNDTYYMQQFNNSLDFGEATPANVMKLDATEPQQGVFDFTRAEQFLEVAERTGKLVRCHNLIWKQQVPSWVTNPAVPWTNETLSAVLANHAQTLVTQFGDRCYSWDVVNEAFLDSPAGAYDNTSIWNQVIGPEHVPMAFKAAADAVKQDNLNVKLYYNDYNIASPGDESTAAQILVKELQGRGIQIDGAGLESHFIGGETPSLASQQENMNAFTALGVDVVVTELDVRITLPPTAVSEAQQVQDYYNTVAACVNVERCIGVTVWDFDDTYSWVPGTFPGTGYADLWFQPGGAGTPLVKKAAYDGCWQALTGAAESA